MKKYFSNIFALAALLMAGAAFTACSSEDNSIEQPANPVGEKTYTLTINASKGANASTRALKLETSGALTAYWENGDELTVFNVTKNAALTGSLTASNASGSTATFSGSLTGTIEVGDMLYLSYHQPTGMSDYSAQTGTLASAAARDFATATVTVASVEGENITITGGSANFDTQTAMLKLTLTDGTTPLNATQLKISATMTVASLPMTEDIATFTLPAATYTTNGGNGILYFALPDKATVAAALVSKIQAKVPDAYKSMVTTDAVATALGGAGGATLTYTATVGSNTYTATKTGYNFVASKYYAGTLTMALPALAITSPAVGQVIGNDGKNYADAAAATDAGHPAVAIITYVGSDNGEAAPYNHGLALALSDANGGGACKWKTSNTDAGHTYKPSSSSFTSESGLQYNATHDIAEYPAFQAAIANNGTAAPTGCSAWFLASGYQWAKMIASYGLTNLKTTANGYTGLESDYYWSSSEHSGIHAWYFHSGEDGWNDGNKRTYHRVRACLAF